jgi:hypothetical protein
MSRSTFVALGLAFAIAAPALGADTGISGQKLVLKVRGTKQKLVFASKDPSTPFPPIGSADDPSVAGVTIDVITPGATGALAVPSGIGNPGWVVKDADVDSYTYRNGTSVRSLGLRQGRTLKLTTRSVPIPMTAPLGSVGIRFTMGGTRVCALFDGASVVADAAGSFTARASSAPADCSTATLGHPAVCGDGVVEQNEECEATSDAACPGQCAADCTCPAVCGDGQRESAEECDGTDFPPFGTGPAACANLGDAVPACQSDCTCCATQLCAAGTFQATCCPGFACPPADGPNARAYCRPSCQTADDCDAGQACFLGFCATPYCTENSQCSGGALTCYEGFCCYFGPGRPYCAF